MHNGKRSPGMTRSISLALKEAHERRVQSLLEVAKFWIGLILPDIEYIVDKAGKLLYKERLGLQKIPLSLRSPSELIVWARPEWEEDDATGLEHYVKWIARWLALCLRGDDLGSFVTM
jgi:hypothetical protein